MDEAASTKHLKAGIAPSLQEFADLVEAESDFSKETLERLLKDLIERQGLKMGKIAQPLRVALTGSNGQPRHLRSHGLVRKSPNPATHPHRRRTRIEKLVFQCSFLVFSFPLPMRGEGRVRGGSIQMEKNSKVTNTRVSSWER